MNNNIRPIAIYLPQFHPIPENDEWWGKGFTEWTNVTKAKPLFKGHYQPNLPGELGFYDLRVPEVREQQAALAREYGIEGFMYWHYWFNGKRILECPFLEVLKTGKPDFPFCLGWANESWTGIWHGAPNRILIEQTYPGIKDYENHFYNILPAFKDHRYIKVDGKCLFLIYRPLQIPDAPSFINLWQKLALENGIGGIHFVGLSGSDIDREKQIILDMGFDAIYPNPVTKTANSIIHKSLILRLRRKLCKYGIYMKHTSKGIFDYLEFTKALVENYKPTDKVYPMLLPNWDNSPRSGKDSLILKNSNPEAFRKHLKEVIELVKDKPEEHRIIFIKSWNEWAEGNYLEPDNRFGRKYLEILKEEITNSAK
jgi:hypothetical protein